MRKFNVFALLVLVTVFMFTSCQKDAIEDVSTTEVTSEETNAPTSIAQKVEGEITTFTEEINTKLTAEKPEVIFDENAAQSRNGEDEIVIAIAGQTKIQIKCGDNISSSNDHRNSSFNDAFYRSRGYSSNLNGGDNVYYFDAPYDASVTFSTSTFSNKRENLAMFLFEGDYDDWNHRARVRNVIAASTSNSIYRESLNNVQLRAGKRYILVVDSAPHRGADYRLTVSCTRIGGGNCDDFEGYRYGNISPQNPSKWMKWDYNSKDGHVDGATNQYMYMARDNYSSFQQDVIYKTGRVNSGMKTLSMDMWVYSGHSGYFNIQKQLRQEFGAELYFYDRGRGEIKIANRSYNFSYTQNKWMDIKLVYDFNRNRVTFKIDGQIIHSWAVSDSSNTTNGSYQIEGVDFYVPQSDSEFFIDNVCFN